MSAAMVLPQLWAMSSSKMGHIDERFGPGSVRFGGPLRLVAKAQPAAIQPVQSVRIRPQFAFYRKYTEAMLQRYLRLSMEAGRTPSLLGQEMFRGNVTRCKVRSFDDVVNFVHDVGNCVRKLGTGQQALVERIAIQGYSHNETAALLGLSLRTVIRRYAEAIDQLTSLFLERKLLEPQNGCQGAEDSCE